MAAASSFSEQSPVKEGEILDAKYRVEKVIGVGGMGIVVSATNLETEERVALKFLLPQAQASDELIGRFMREAKSSVKLKGKHVAKTIDVGRMDDGRAFIVMELLEGNDLGAEIKASRGTQFPIEDAVSWLLQACEGLAEAHALGIVHRDLKPANLFLSRDKRLVKVLDFGISKSINPSSSDMLSLTKTEMLLGSPLYMAPEQMRSSKYVDERSDLWSLGAVAYELLTGHVPFEADTLLDLCFKVAQEGCSPAIELRPEMPQGLSDAVMRCLEKDAPLRWNNVGEFAKALEPFAGPADRGSAQRTIDVLNGGDPKLRARGESQIPDSPPPAPKRHIVGPDQQAITGSSPTERAPSADDEGSADNIPPSSAWGATQSEPVPQKRNNWKAPAAIAAIGIVVAAASFMLSRGASKQEAAPPPPPPVVTPQAKQPDPVVVPPPLPSATETAAPSETTAAPPPPVKAAPKPPPKPKASASAAPADSSGFIKFRE